MCGKTATYNLRWSEVYGYASALTPPPELPPEPETRINISPSRLRRKSEPESMVWETVPVIVRRDGVDMAAEAIWPFLPAYSEGRLPTNKQGLGSRQLRNIVEIAMEHACDSLRADGFEIEAQELRAALYNAEAPPEIFGYIAGLGGRDVTPETIEDIYWQTKKEDRLQTDNMWIGLDQETLESWRN